MHARPSMSRIALAIAAGVLGGAALSPGERELQRLFNSGGPGWNYYPASRDHNTGAAAQKRASRKRRNIRARAAK